MAWRCGGREQGMLSCASRVQHKQESVGSLGRTSPRLRTEPLGLQNGQHAGFAKMCHRARTLSGTWERGESRSGAATDLRSSAAPCLPAAAPEVPAVSAAAAGSACVESQTHEAEATSAAEDRTPSAPLPYRVPASAPVGVAVRILQEEPGLRGVGLYLLCDADSAGAGAPPGASCSGVGVLSSCSRD